MGRHKSAINALIALKRVRASILAAPYMSKIFMQTVMDLSTLRWFPRWMHDFRKFDVFHNITHIIQVKHSAKNRGIGHHLFGLCKRRISK